MGGVPALAEGAVPMYTPTVRGGKKMSVGMLCLGRHWNALTYTLRGRAIGLRRSGRPADSRRFLDAWPRAAAAGAGFTMRPDLCIMNYYDRDSRMGVHQDKDERPESIEAGVPIVSVSLGDTARFVVGGLARKEPMSPIDAAVGRCPRDGRSIAPALSRRDEDPSRHRAGHAVLAGSI